MSLWSLASLNQQFEIEAEYAENGLWSLAFLNLQFEREAEYSENGLRSEEQSSLSQQFEGEAEYAENDNLIDFISEPPSLQDILLVPVATRLWTEPDILKKIEQLFEYHGWTALDITIYYYIYKELEEAVSKKLSKLSLPNAIKMKVKNILSPIGFQLLKSSQNKNLRGYMVKDVYEVGKSVSWTMYGTINETKMVKEFIQNDAEEKNIYILYELACEYCLEDMIFVLWEGMSSSIRQQPFRFSHIDYVYHIITYWTAILSNKVQDLLDIFKNNDNRNIYNSDFSINQNMTTLSVFLGNKFALKYFWPKLSEKEKTLSIENWVTLTVQQYNRIDYVFNYQLSNQVADNLCFLLSQFKDKNHQKQSFLTHSEIILHILFLHWPWQRFFLSTFNFMKNTISEHTFVILMLNITNIIEERRISGEVLKEIWCISTLKQKNCFTPHLSRSVWTLVLVGDVETILAILNNVSAKEKKHIFLDMIQYCEVHELKNTNTLSALDTLLPNCLASDQDVNYFKACVIIEKTHEISRLIQKGFYKGLAELLSWGLQTGNEIEKFKKSINPFKTYAAFIRFENYEGLDEFINWYFVSTEERNSLLKAFLLENFSRCLSLLMNFSSSYSNEWDKFIKFTNYFLRSTELVTEFKSVYLKAVPIFVKHNRLQFATKFLNWCLNSVDEINLFKKKLLLSKKGVGFLLHDANNMYWMNVKCKLEWFFPLTTETIDELKSLLNVYRFIGYYEKYDPENIRQAFFYLLDRLVLTYGAPDCDSKIDFSHLKAILKGKFNSNTIFQNDDTHVYSDSDENSYSSYDDDYYDSGWY